MLRLEGCPISGNLLLQTSKAPLIARTQCDLRTRMCEELHTKMASFAWSVEKTFDLIARYEAYPCLYNTKHQDYHDRNLRSKALGEIAANLDVPGKLSVYVQ